MYSLNKRCFFMLIMLECIKAIKWFIILWHNLQAILRSSFTIATTCIQSFRILFFLTQNELLIFFVVLFWTFLSTSICHYYVSNWILILKCYSIYFSLSRKCNVENSFLILTTKSRKIWFSLKSRVEISFDLTHRLIKMKIIECKINHLNIVRLWYNWEVTRVEWIWFSRNKHI